MERYLKDERIFQYRLISPGEIPFSQSVIDACRANKCGRYGAFWTCPPGVGDPEQLKAKIRGYKRAAVFTCKYELEDPFDLDGMTAGARSTAGILREITARMRADGVDFMALGCEGCSLCEKCSYPSSPCRFPNEAVPSVEACGVNVVELARKAGINYNNGSCTVTYFCVILTR